MVSVQAGRGQITCSQCSAPLPDESPDSPWCDHCGWNVPIDAPLFRGNAVVRAYETLGFWRSRRLFADLVRRPHYRRGRAWSEGITFGIATLVHSLTLLCLFLGLAIVIFLWPNPAGFVLAAFFGVLAWALAPQLPPQPEILLDRADFPALYDCIDALADALGTARVAGIACELDFNAGFGQASWRRRGTLYLGMPLWAILDDQERLALLAHELAHGLHRDAPRHFLIGGAIATLNNWCNLLSPPMIDGGFVEVGVGLVIMRILSIIPRSLRFLMLHLLWHSAQCAEYRADRCAASVAGTEATAALLCKLGLDRDWPHVLRAATQRGWSAGLFAALRRRCSYTTPRELARRHWVAHASIARLDVTHPPTAYRIAVLRAHPSPLPADFVFAVNWAAVAEETAKIEVAFERYLDRFHDHPADWGSPRTPS